MIKLQNFLRMQCNLQDESINNFQLKQMEKFIVKQIAVDAIISTPPSHSAFLPLEERSEASAGKIFFRNRAANKINKTRQNKRSEAGVRRDRGGWENKTEQSEKEFISTWGIKLTVNDVE